MNGHKPKSRIRTVLEMIKFEHSVFALPFALVGALLATRAAGARLTWTQFAWIIVAMVGARSAAMTMNRIADVEYDRRNPRTANRALPAGELSLGFAYFFTALSSAVLIFAAWRLSPLAFKLSPVALAILFFYSYTKRFTSWSHFVLGFCLGISPAAAWIAVRGSLDWRMLILCAAVTLWVGGFDVLYACQDVEFDKSAGLFSIPKRFGITRALQVARVMHASWLFYWCGSPRVSISPGRLGGNRCGRRPACLRAFALKPNDLSKMNAAFFTINGYISLLFLLFWGAAAFVMHS